MTVNWHASKDSSAAVLQPCFTSRAPLPLPPNMGFHSHWAGLLLTSRMYSLVVSTSSWYTTHCGWCWKMALEGWMNTGWPSTTAGRQGGQRQVSRRGSREEDGCNCNSGCQFPAAAAAATRLVPFLGVLACTSQLASTCSPTSTEACSAAAPTGLVALLRVFARGVEEEAGADGLLDLLVVSPRCGTCEHRGSVSQASLAPAEGKEEHCC